VKIGLPASSARRLAACLLLGATVAPANRGHFLASQASPVLDVGHSVPH